MFVVSVSGHKSQLWNDLSLIDCLVRSKHYAAMKALNDGVSDLMEAIDLGKKAL